MRTPVADNMEQAMKNANSTAAVRRVATNTTGFIYAFQNSVQHVSNLHFVEYGPLHGKNIAT